MNFLRLLFLSTSCLLLSVPLSAQVRGGFISGKVTDAKTGRGISGATVSLGPSDRSVLTGEDGFYRLTGIEVGNHMLSVRLVGYTRQTRSVTIGVGALVVADFKLAPSTSLLNEVVITGTIVATKLRSVPNAITVVTAKQIEERGITNIEQLFRGDIPGLFALEIGSRGQAGGSANAIAQSIMFSRGATSLQLNPNPQDAATNPIKTYIDGIELADPGYLNQIDPKSIERIEILTGPQASTIYGSNAINGVMQIFTKRGNTIWPQLTLSVISGIAQNDLNNRLTSSHNVDARVSGNEGRWSYNVGGSWNYTGSWVPSRRLNQISSYGSGRLQFGKFTADLSMRDGRAQNHARGSTSEKNTQLRTVGVYTVSASGGRNASRTSTVTSTTFGLTVGYNPAQWWSNELIAGHDVSNAEVLETETAFFGPSDTLLSVEQRGKARNSQRYTTSLQVPVTSMVKITLSTGVDHWRATRLQIDASPATLTGPLDGSSINRGRPQKNTGAFLQGQIGLQDALFFTYGLRSEWNPEYGEDAQPNFAPRYGIAYTRDIGPITTKLRASYGRSTRPPSEDEKIGLRQTNATTLMRYGSFYYLLPNPELGPEFQQGGEGGVEFYLGNRASFVLTRYNQTVDALITGITGVDSVQSLLPDADFNCGNNVAEDGYCYFRQTQNLNVGSIRNQGWELQGSVSFASVTVNGTYSWTKSRMIGITSKYRTMLAGTQYQPGFPFTYIPEHTGALSVKYTRARTGIAVTMNGTGFLYRNSDELSIALDGRIRLGLTRPRSSLPDNYRNTGPGYVTADLNAYHNFSSRFESVLSIKNLTDFYQNDYDVQHATIGRQTKLGMRVRI